MAETPYKERIRKPQAAVSGSSVYLEWAPDRGDQNMDRKMLSTIQAARE